jgi:rhamnopyranosyl-N-acetylglucosaminyl-diphospho-decaprenol beta-1,3/1,4-galactofuranosyltransferase
MSSSVTAVVVTYNRSDLLAECLDALAAQSRPADRVVVVDNASTDATPTLLADRPAVDVVRLNHNTGGAGGFAAGLAVALERPCDLVWLLDDDTIPTPGALEQLLRAREHYPGPLPVVVASRVLWVDGRDHPMNTPRARPGVTRAETQAAGAVGARPIRSASFVSILVDTRAVRARGLPVADYFLWNDDFEYTTRLLRGNVGLYVPDSTVVHKTATFGSTDADPGERFYYEVRNKVWTFTRSRGLSPSEKALYGASTLRRWARTFARSPRRDVLWRGMRAAVRDARTGPRLTAAVLAEAGLPGSSS